MGAVLAEPTLLLAQSTDKPSTSKPSMSGIKLYEKGARSFEAGKYEAAITSLTSSLSAGGLTSQQMAKALYYRGLAYRKQGKNPLAISDLTSAIWLKSGLSDTERAVAIDQRQAAYREAGLGDGMTIGAAPLDGPPTYKAVGLNGEKNQISTSATVPSGSTGSMSGPSSSTVPSTSNTQYVSSYPSTTGGISDLASSQKTGLALSANDPQAEQPRTGVEKTTVATVDTNYSSKDNGAQIASNSNPTSEEPALTTLVGLIESIFGSGNPSEQKELSEEANSLATSSTKQLINTPQPQISVSDWNTTVANTNTKNVQKNIDTIKVSPVKFSDKAQGKYRLQVAVLRSRNKAEDIASELRRKYGNDFGSAATAIDEVVYGNMGKFYRLQLGPYANATAAANFCNILKPQGYDCMVVTQ